MSSITSKFFVERPIGEYWNTGMTNTVVEAVEQPADKWGTVSLKVLSPESFAWKDVKKSLFIECSGPVRALDYKQYVHLIHSLIPQRTMPKGWKE